MGRGSGKKQKGVEVSGSGIWKEKMTFQILQGQSA